MDVDEYTARFVANVKRLMEARGYGTNDLAGLLKVKAPVVSRILHDASPPRASTIVAICTVFGVDVCDLFCAAKKPAKPKKRAKP